MIVAQDNTQLFNGLNDLKATNKCIGFVPTMGALHKGHLSLIAKSTLQNDLTVVSIFVNPKQFNNSDDLEKYPRTPEKDIELLKDCKVDLIYIPTEKEIYPIDYQAPFIDLGILDKVLEGKYRKNHFKGVAEVVHRLFSLVGPQNAYFGKKDLQQVAVIKKMVKNTRLPVTIITTETHREENGLAMSSRNIRLSEKDKKEALSIYKTLTYAKEICEKQQLNTIEIAALNYFQSLTNHLKIEYLSLLDVQTFTTPSPSSRKEDIYVCLAAWCGNIRLIDNIQLFV